MKRGIARFAAAAGLWGLCLTPALAGLSFQAQPDGTTAILDRDGSVVGTVVEGAPESASLAAPAQLPGWPVSLGEVCSTPSVADLDGDGILEVVFANVDSSLYVVDVAGQVRPGWPVLLSDFSTLAAPSLVDLDGDGALDVLIGATRVTHAIRPNGTALPGWPVTVSGRPPEIAVEDLDGDGQWDLAAPGKGEAYLWSPTGVLQAGWPLVFPSAGDAANHGPAVGSVDEEPALEIAFAMGALPSLYVVDPSGAVRSGFPITYEFGISGVSMADANGDGTLDLWFREDENTWILDGNGQALPGWPVWSRNVGNAPPAIGDIDGDLDLEMVWASPGGDGQVFAYHHDGTLVPGWPVTVPAFTFNAQATLGDVDGDGGVDVVIGGSTATFSAVGRIYAWHADGSLVAGFPFDVPEGKAVLWSATTITDLDQDGDVDLLVGTVTGFGGLSNGRVFAFDLRAPYDPKTMEWPTKAHDIRNTSRYESPNHFPVAVPGADLEVECAAAAATPVRLDGSASSDADSSPGTNDDIVSFEWFEDFGLASERFLGAGAVLETALPLGTHALTLRVEDRTGRVGTDEVAVTVADTIPPELVLAPVPAELWPPNHRMVEVEMQASLIDACGSASLILLTGVASSEPDDAPGDGDGETVDDIQGVELLTGDTAFRLRAERSGEGDGRVYTVTYSASDGFHPVSGTVEVRVPHDAGGGADPLLLELAETPPGTLLRWEGVAGAFSYRVIRGELQNLQSSGAGFDLGPVSCVLNAAAATSTAGSEDAEAPARGAGFFYLAEYEAETRSGYGTGSAERQRVVPAGEGCPQR